MNTPDRLKTTVENCLAVFLASASLTSFIAAVNSILTTGVLALNIWFLIRKIQRKDESADAKAMADRGGRRKDEGAGSRDGNDGGKVILLLLLASTLSGCGTLVPEKRSQSQAFDSAESLHTQNGLSIRKTLESTPMVPVRQVLPTNPASTPKISQPAATRLHQDSGAAVPTAETNPFDTQAWAWPIATRETVSITDNSSTGAGANEAAKGWKESQIPFGVSLILFGAGVVAVVVAWRIARASSASVDAASQAADQFAAGLIRKLRDRAMHSTDSGELAKLNSDIASLEAERGRLATGR